MKFLNTLHWLLIQVGPIETLFSTETTSHTKNMICSVAAAYQHVVIAIQYTFVSCLHYLKLASEALIPKARKMHRQTDTEMIEDGLDCIPRFDTSFLGDVVSSNENNESNDTLLNYELSTMNIEKIIRLMIKRQIFSLIALCKCRFEKTEKILDSLHSPNSVFGCVCLQDLILVLYHFMYVYCPKQIWMVLSQCMNVIENSTNEANMQKLYRFFWNFLVHFFRLISVYTESYISENKPKDVINGFSAENCNDAMRTRESSTDGVDILFEDSKELITSYLKETLKLLDTKSSESSLKNLLMAIAHISVISRKKADLNTNDNSVTNILALSLLWDFFSKRLNNTFQGSTLTGLQMIPTSQEMWVSHVNDSILISNDNNDEITRKGDESTDDCSNASCYYLFVRIISIQIKPEVSNIRENFHKLLSKSKLNKAIKQFVGRLRSKLPCSKIQGLEDVGLHNLFTMFIAMILSQRGTNYENFFGISVIAEAVLGIAKEEIKPANSVPPKRIPIYIRGIVTVTVILVQIVSNSFPKYASETSYYEELQNEKQKIFELIKSFIDLLSQRIESVIETSSLPTAGLDKLSFSHADNAMRVYCDFMQDHNCLLNSICISQTNLIFSGIGKYLQQKYKTNSGISEVNNVLTSLIAVTTRVRKYYQHVEKSGYISLSVEEKKCKERVDETCLNLWKYIYPVVKTNLCTYNGGISGSLSSRIACKVAEYIITMTLLSQDLSSFSFPLQCNTSSMDNFNDMVKYYSQSSVVHPSVSSAFLLNVLQQHKRGLDLDQSQVQLLIKSWIRCNTLLMPNDEILSSLPRYIVPLCKDLSISDTSKWNANNGVSLFIQELSKHHIRNGFSQNLTKNYEPFFDSYIDCLKRNFPQALQNGSQAYVHRFYEIGSIMVKHCARMLYKEKVHNKLQPILEKLFTSASMLQEQYCMTNDVKFATCQTLPDFVRGLCTLQNLQNDQFLMRHLRYIFVSYLNRFDNNERHPFIEVFKTGTSSEMQASADYPMSSFINIQDVYPLFFSCLKNESFSKQPNHKQRQKLKYALGFILALVKCVPGMSSIVVKNLFGAVIDIRLTISNDDSGVKNLAAELISKLVKYTDLGQHELQNGPSLSQLLLLELEKIIQSHLGFYVEETFQLLIALSTLNKRLIESLIPSIELSVKEIEIKRGIDTSDGGQFQKRLNELKKRL